jgi:hypothetical protein
MADYLRKINSLNTPGQVTELTKENKDKIAEIIETKYREHWLAPTVKDFVYGTTRALDFGDFHGTLGKKFGNHLSDWEWAVNRNADLFNYDEIVEASDDGAPRYLSFRKAAMHVNHNSHDPQLAIGLVFDSTLVMDKYGDTHVVILFGVDRMKAATIARTLETYPTRLYTSMGCSIKSSMCTVCSKQILKDADFCDCLRYHRGSRIKGRKAAELLQKMAFYEQSIVTTPACPNAGVIDAVSEILPGRILKVASELDNDGNLVLRIMANIHQAIKSANSAQEKKRLANQLDALIDKLENMVSVGVGF